MAKSTNHWYVLVLTEEGAKFVTELGEHHTAHFKDDGQPKEFSKEMALDIANGLTWNAIPAYCVCTAHVLDYGQPYMYDKGRFHWEWYPTEKDLGNK